MKNMTYLFLILLMANGCNSVLKEECFEVVYPLSYLMPDNSIIVVEGEKSDKSAFTEWYDAHPDVIEKPTLVYPVEVLVLGNLELVETESRMIKIKKGCYSAKGKDKKDYGDKSDDLKFDCPELKADIGDACKKTDGKEGTVSTECSCV